MSLYIAIIAAAAVTSWLSVTISRSRARILSVAALVSLAVLLPYAYWDTLSRPKALDDETRKDEEVAVLAYVADPGNSLWLWLGLPGVAEPRYYVMPWGEEARKMTQKLQEGKEKGQQMMMKNPFEPSLENERSVHPMPQPALPQKEEPQKPKEYGI